MRVLFVAIILFALGGIVVMFIPLGEQPAGQGAAAVELGSFGRVAPFSFTDESGQPFSSESLAGKVWLANFVFTSCTAECPILSERMAQVRRNLGAREDIAFVSLSVDPQTDSPQRLKEYAQRFGEDRRWSLLTGDPSRLDALVKKGLLLPVTQSYVERQELVATGFVHSNKMLVIDRGGSIRFAADGLEAGAVERLTRAMEMALAN